MSERLHMMVLTAAASGGLMPLRGRIDVRGGKVEKVDVPLSELATWLELLKTIRIELETAQRKAEGGTDGL